MRRVDSLEKIYCLTPFVRFDLRHRWDQFLIYVFKTLPSNMAACGLTTGSAAEIEWVGPLGIVNPGCQAYVLVQPCSDIALSFVKEFWQSFLVHLEQLSSPDSVCLHICCSVVRPSLGSWCRVCIFA